MSTFINGISYPLMMFPLSHQPNLVSLSPENANSLARILNFTPKQPAKFMMTPVGGQMHVAEGSALVVDNISKKAIQVKVSENNKDSKPRLVANTYAVSPTVVPAAATAAAAAPVATAVPTALIQKAGSAGVSALVDESDFIKILNRLNDNINDENDWRLLSQLVEKSQSSFDKKVPLIEILSDNNVILKLSKIIFNFSTCDKNLRLNLIRNLFVKLSVISPLSGPNLPSGTYFFIRKYIQFEYVFGNREEAKKIIFKLLDSGQHFAGMTIFSLNFFYQVNDYKNAMFVIERMLKLPVIYDYYLFETAIKVCHLANKPEYIEKILNYIVKCNFPANFGDETALRVLESCKTENYQQALKIINSFDVKNCDQQNCNKILRLLILKRMIAENLNDNALKDEVRKEICSHIDKTNFESTVLRFLKVWLSSEIASGDLIVALPLIDKYLVNFVEPWLKSNKDKINLVWDLYILNIRAAMSIGNFSGAIELCEQTNEKFPDHHRVIEFYLLNKFCSQETEADYLRQIMSFLKDHPKIGNLWKLAAQIFMNPQSKLFNLNLAEGYLLRALKLTPQDEDITIEIMKLMVLKKNLLKTVDQTDIVAFIEECCLDFEKGSHYGIQWDYCDMLTGEFSTKKEILFKALEKIESNYNHYAAFYQSAINGRILFDPTCSRPADKLRKEDLYLKLSTAVGNPFEFLREMMTADNQTIGQKLKYAKTLFSTAI